MTKKILFSVLFAVSCLAISAQPGERTVNVFQPHWYIQLQGGGQYTLGEIDFDKLLSPNAQVAVGYNFNKVVGARLNVNGWQSKAGSKLNGKTYKWKYNYVAPALDATFNLSNLFCKYNPNRVVNVGVFAGIGLNIAFNNDEACDAAKAMLADNAATVAADDQFVRNLWDGTKTRLMGQFGATVDFRISKAVSLGLEVSANTVNDHYNSKKAGNADWYFNALAGVKINLGKTNTQKTVPPCCKQPAPAPEPKVIEKVVEKIVEKPVEKKIVETKKAEPLRRDIFFTIKSTQITSNEMVKVGEIAEYLNQNPDAKVAITGYADKGTGNATINQNLSAKRVDIVAKTLKTKYGIAANRISTDCKGDKEQPFAVNEQNRVSICIAK
jgi:outer membrane protein OmpA-like peptidoglycan-associated protein